MRLAIITLIAASSIAAVPAALAASSGGPMGGSSDFNAPREQTPKERARTAYNEGLRAVRKADNQAAAAAKATDERKKEKATKKSMELYERARDSFTLAVQNLDTMHEAWNYLGYTRRKLGEYESALTAYDRALALRPRLLICDEAVSALDVSVQAQIINLFMQLRREHGLTYVFISHNLAVVEHMSDRVAIMYLGRVVESGDARTVFAAPNHPYTRALLADAPRLGGGTASHQPIRGELPSPLAPPSGCAFHPRCPHASARCAAEVPVLRDIGGRLSACHLND